MRGKKLPLGGIAIRSLLSNIFWVFLLFLGVWLLPFKLLYAYGVWEDDLFSTLSRRSQKSSHSWGSSFLGVVDGKIKTTPPDEEIYDRRLDLRLSVGGEAFFMSRFGMRLHVASEYEMKRIAGRDPNLAIIDEQKAVLRPALDATFITDKGLELTLGFLSYHYGTDKKTTAMNFGDTVITYRPARVLGKRFGVLRRASDWNGGFAFTQGGNSTRSQKEQVFDGSETELVDIIFMPSRIDMFGEGGKTTKLRFNIGFIQARGLGPKDNKGQTVFTDHIEALLGGVSPVGTGIFVDVALGHRTLAYSSSAFVTLDSMPVSSLHLRYRLGPQDDGEFFGVFGHYGKDGQSLPEFNSKFEVFGGGFEAGLCYRL